MWLDMATVGITLQKQLQVLVLSRFLSQSSDCDWQSYLDDITNSFSTYIALL